MTDLPLPSVLDRVGYVHTEMLRQITNLLNEMKQDEMIEFSAYEDILGVTEQIVELELDRIERLSAVGYVVKEIV